MIPGHFLSQMELIESRLTTTNGNNDPGHHITSPMTIDVTSVQVFLHAGMAPRIPMTSLYLVTYDCSH
jgi:hypothetical protein